MKHKVKYDLVLFAILAVLAFLPMLQKKTGWFKLEPLKGVYPTTPYPLFTLETFRSGEYQRQLEAQLSERFGFREPIIRLYNQYLWDCYRKTYVEEIVPGRDNWLYYQQSVSDYYGAEMYRWQPNAETARTAFDREAVRMWKLRQVLKDYGVDFLMFMAPEKGFLYPEHLPRLKIDTTSVNAREYYAAKFEEMGFPYIEMTRWFLALKEADTLPFSLMSQSGAHWGFSSVVAADSLLKLMGSLSGEALPKLVVGPYHESADSTQQGDCDLEMNLNLLRPLPRPYDRLIDAEVSIEADSTVRKPNVLFVGNSFLWRMHHYIPFDELFTSSEYWFYNSTAYYGKGYAQQANVGDLDMLEKLLDADYIVWFTTGNQMYKMSYAFVESALMQLCLSKERRDEVLIQLIDSLIVADIPDVSNCESLRHAYWEKANELILLNPEQYFPELAGEDIPESRNPRIDEVLIIKEIRKDSVWMATLDCQTVIQNAPLERVLSMEAQNLLNDRALLRDMEDVPLRKAFVEWRVRQMEKLIQASPVLLDSLRAKAQRNGKPLEEQLHTDAGWMVHRELENEGFAFPEREEMQLTLLRDAFLHSPAYDSLVEAIARELRTHPGVMEQLGEKAARNGKSLEDQLNDDARWMANEKLKKGEVGPALD